MGRPRGAWHCLGSRVVANDPAWVLAILVLLLTSPADRDARQAWKGTSVRIHARLRLSFSGTASGTA